MSSSARLTWGSTALMPTSTKPEADLRAGLTKFYIEASPDGTTFGNPEAVISAIRSHLQDGSLASVTSYDNREGVVTLRAKAMGYDGLDLAERTLTAESKVPGYSTLTWTPNVALAYPTVYDVVYSVLSWQFDDRAETKDASGMLRRRFTVQFELLPFGRDVNMTSVQAITGLQPTPSTVLVNDGSSTTGWTGNGTVTTASGYVQNAGGVADPFGRGTAVSLTYNASVDTSVTKYIWVDYYTSPASAQLVALTTNGSSGTSTSNPVYLGSADVPGFTRAIFQINQTTMSSMQFATFVPSDGTTPTLRIDKVQRSNTLPVAGTNKQQSRSVTVGGSARARAALAVTADAGKTLGDITIVYTRTATTGLQPSLRQYRSASSSIAADSTLISGAYNALGSQMVFLLPANRIREAAHNLIGRLRATTAGTYNLTWTAALVSSTGADLPETSQGTTGTTTLPFATANTWQTSEIALIQLPIVPVAMDSTHLVRLTLQAFTTAGAAATAVQIDEGWLFDLDNGVLSWVNTTGLTRLEVRTADLANPEPSCWVGTADGGGATGLVRGDWRTVPSMDGARGAAFPSGQGHLFEPGTMDVFVVTSGTEGAACTVTYYRSWLHNAGAPEAA